MLIKNWRNLWEVKKMDLDKSECLTLNCQSFSRKGIGKDHNEDCFLVNDMYSCFEEECRVDVSFNSWDLTILAVCDGVSGGGNGQDSSKTTVNLLRHLYDNKNIIGQSEDFKRFLRRVEHEIQETNWKIYNLFAESGENMWGTTLALLIIFRNNGVVYNVGDSRIYRVRNKLLTQLTRDHTVAEYKRQMGFFNEDPYITETDKKTLYQYLGKKEEIEMYKYGPFALNKNDRFLICTDGISGTLGRKELLLEMDKNSKNIIELLAEKSLRQGSQDDQTGIYIYTD